MGHAWDMGKIADREGFDQHLAETWQGGKVASGGTRRTLAEARSVLWFTFGASQL